MTILAVAFIFFLVTDRRRYNDDPYFASHADDMRPLDPDPWDRYYLPREQHSLYEAYRQGDDYRLEQMRRYRLRRRMQHREDVGADMMAIFMVALVIAAFVAYLRWGGG